MRLYETNHCPDGTGHGLAHRPAGAHHHECLRHAHRRGYAARTLGHRLGRGVRPLCGGRLLCHQKEGGAGPQGQNPAGHVRGLRLRALRPEAALLQRLLLSPHWCGPGGHPLRAHDHGGAGAHRAAVPGSAAGPRGPYHPGGQPVFHGHCRAHPGLAGLSAAAEGQSPRRSGGVCRRCPGRSVYLCGHLGAAGRH